MLKAKGGDRYIHCEFFSVLDVPNRVLLPLYRVPV